MAGMSKIGHNLLRKIDIINKKGIIIQSLTEDRKDEDKKRTKN